MPTDGRKPRVTSFIAKREDPGCSVEEICFRFLCYFIYVFIFYFLFIFLPFDMFISHTAVCQAHVCYYQLPSCDVIFFSF
jgi:hypothetical protein